MAQRGEPLAQLIDYPALLAINGSIINRLFREANIPPDQSGAILGLRYSRKKAIDKRNQRIRDRGNLLELNFELFVLLEKKNKLQEEREKLTNEISFYSCHL